MSNRELFTLLLRHRIIFLGEEINSEIANTLVAQVLLLDAESPGERIDMYINSPGGSVCDGLAIIDVMRMIRSPVSTICVGEAASMAAWILAAGEKGSRFATPNSEIMIHQIFTGFRGRTSDIEVESRKLIADQKRMVEMLAEFTGQSPEKISSDVQANFYMNAQEAKEYGIIDELIEHRKGTQ